MKNRWLIASTLLGVLFFISNCSNPKPQEKSRVDEAAMDSVINAVQEEDEDLPQINERCFESAIAAKNQSGRSELKFMTVGKNATGKLNSLPSTGDSIIGMFTGTLAESIIRGRYTFKEGENMRSARIAIVVQDGGATVFMVNSDEEHLLTEDALSTLEPYQVLTEIDCR